MIFFGNQSFNFIINERKSQLYFLTLQLSFALIFDAQFVKIESKTLTVFQSFVLLLVYKN